MKPIGSMLRQHENMKDYGRIHINVGDTLEW